MDSFDYNVVDVAEQKHKKIRSNTHLRQRSKKMRWCMTEKEKYEKSMNMKMKAFTRQKRQIYT